MKGSIESKSSIYTWCEVDGAHEAKSKTGTIEERVIEFEDGSPRRFQLQSDTQTSSYDANKLPLNPIVSERSEDAIHRQSSFTSTISNIDASTPQLQNTTNSTADSCQSLISIPSSVSTTDMLRTHVGIGIGAAIGGIALGAMIGIICMRYRMRKKVNVDPEAKGGETRRCGHIPVANFMSDFPSTERERTYENPNGEEVQEHSPIYPDESASFYDPRASPHTIRAYATDFALADRQVWREHIQSSPDLGIIQHPGSETGGNDSTRAKDSVPIEADPIEAPHR